MFIVPLHKALSSMPKQSYPMMLDLIKSEEVDSVQTTLNTYKFKFRLSSVKCVDSGEFQQLVGSFLSVILSRRVLACFIQFVTKFLNIC